MRSGSRQDRITGGLYFAYCTGLSIEEVAAQFGRTPFSVRSRFRRHSLPLRKVEARIPRNPIRASGHSFEESNRAKSLLAAEAKRSQFEAALQTETNPRMRSVLELRLQHPDMSLWELGELHEPRLSKDTVSALLRRAVKRVAS